MSDHINDTISIQQLPPELLVYILHLVRDASLEDSLDKHSDRAFSLAWIKVSFVSRRWRELAIGAPSLWAHIDLTMPLHALVMLRRSQAAPLHLYTCPYPKATFVARNPVWLIVSRNISRVQELNLPMIDPKELEFLSQDTDVPAPFLESILIHGIQFLRPPSLTRFFERKMPSLRVINIRNFILPRPLPAFPQLISLKLHGLNNGGGILTVLDTLALLETTPMLENVELFRMLLPTAPDTPSSALAQHKPVNLPKLKTFWIDTANPDSLFIINTLRYPMDATIDITCRESHLTEAMIEVAVNIVRSRLRDYPFPISSARIHYDDVRIELDARTYGVIPLSFILCAVTSPAPSEMLLRRLCEVMPWESIQRVLIDLIVLPVSWAQVVARWSRVETVFALVPDSSRLPKFIEGLHDGLPKLEMLVLHGCDVKPCLHLLVDMLRHRKARGLRPLQLCLKENPEVGVDELSGLATVIKYFEFAPW